MILVKFTMLLSNETELKQTLYYEKKMLYYFLQYLHLNLGAGI